MVESLPIQSINLTHTSLVRYITHLKDGTFVSCGNDGRVKRWSIAGVKLNNFKGHTRWVTCAVQLDEATVITGSEDCHLKVWDLNTGLCKQTIHTPNSECWCLWLNHNKTLLFCGSSTSEIEVRRVNELEKVYFTLCGHEDYVMSICDFKSPASKRQNERMLVSGSRDGTLKVWNLESHKAIKTLVGHSNWIYKVVTLRDEKTVVSSSMAFSVKLWDIANGLCLCTFSEHRGFVYTILELSDGTIATGSRDNTFKLWKTTPQQTTDGNQERFLGPVLQPTMWDILCITLKS